MCETPFDRLPLGAALGPYAYTAKPYTYCYLLKLLR
jgi:hypothetical protein